MTKQTPAIQTGIDTVIRSALNVHVRRPPDSMPTDINMSVFIKRTTIVGIFDKQP